MQKQNLIPAREWRDLVIAWVAISLAFTFIFVRTRIDPFLFVLFLFVSLITVGIGIVLHELAHKFMAIHFGYWAEFKKDSTMLVVALALAALVGVVFAAPGATWIYGNTTKRENGLISAVGPITNIFLCIPFIGIILLGVNGSLLTLIGTVGLSVNAMIAAFNMIPVSVLDGRKVLAWNPGVFVVLIAVAFGMVFLSYYPSFL